MYFLLFFKRELVLIRQINLVRKYLIKLIISFGCSNGENRNEKSKNNTKSHYCSIISLIEIEKEVFYVVVAKN